MLLPELDPELPELPELELLELELPDELPPVLASPPGEAPPLDELHAPKAATESMESEPNAKSENFV